MSTYEDDRGNGQLPLVPGDDGVTDAANDASERIFGGRPILKYTDRQYTLGKDRDEVPLGTKKIFLSTVHYWQPWPPDGDGKRGKPIIRKPGQRMLERDELVPAYDDKSQWKILNGEPQDPWQNTRAMLLEDVETGEQCVFVTTSNGGRGAVMDLCSEIQRMRNVHPDARPVTELRWANMPTQYGLKTKPLFKIVQWLTVDNVPIAERTVSAKEAKKIVDQREREEINAQIDDGIPF